MQKIKLQEAFMPVAGYADGLATIMSYNEDDELVPSLDKDGNEQIGFRFVAEVDYISSAALKYSEDGKRYHSLKLTDLHGRPHKGRMWEGNYKLLMEDFNDHQQMVDNLPGLDLLGEFRILENSKGKKYMPLSVSHLKANADALGMFDIDVDNIELPAASGKGPKVGKKKAKKKAKK